MNPNASPTRAATPPDPLQVAAPVEVDIMPDHHRFPEGDRA